ncbi:hypothetical protein ABOM_002661 [Aspergillus bombycis]|uniref:Uncharacterized protein n=1 Tax=Aspergillus bombycis TaxID=109264 RepID=A0A1F8A8E8_9EURO|nr:hypothetical protein ABOM_002661 [Aspergillus bombycis]OGM47953.1 hypothetical protein ABOM_002661 [Aspergillus bombycis]
MSLRRRAREDAERRLQLTTTLFHLLDQCHEDLSREIRVETDAALTTQGNVTDPVNRLGLSSLISKTESGRDSSVQLTLPHAHSFPPIPKTTLRNFKRDKVDNFVGEIIEALQDDETSRREFGIEGRVAFYDRTNSTLLDDSLEQMRLNDAPDAPHQPPNTNRREGGRKRRGKQVAQSQMMAHPGWRRNRRADQFCVHLVADERQIPVYVVEFKAPHELKVAELVVGFREMDLGRDIINQEGDTFECHATTLAAVSA